MSNKTFDEIYKFLASLDQDSIQFVVKTASKMIQTFCPSLPSDIWKLIFTKANIFSDALLDHTTIYYILHTTLPMKLVCKEWAKMIEDVYASQLPMNATSVKQLIYCAATLKNKPILDYVLKRLKGVWFFVRDNELTIKTIWNVASDIGDPVLFKALLSDNELHTNHMWKHFQRVIRWGHCDAFRVLLQDKHAVNTVNNDTLVITVVELGCKNIVKTFMSCYEFSPKITANCVLRRASSCTTRGDIVTLLLNDSRIDPCCDNAKSLSEAIISKIRGSHLGTVKALLGDSRISKRSENKYLLFDAVQKGDLLLVKLLLKYSFTDPALHNNYAYHLALLHKHQEIADHLLKVQGITPHDIQPLCKNPNHVHVARDTVLGEKKSDVFGIDYQGFTDVQIAEKVCLMSGFKRPISWETQRIGRRADVICLDSPLPYNSPCYWICTKDGGSYPLVFSLVCERK